MNYTRDLIFQFNHEAKRRGIDINQLPSGEAHIFKQKMEAQLDEHLNISTKVYFDQMEKRGFTKESQNSIESIINNASKNLAILENMLGGGKK